MRYRVKDEGVRWLTESGGRSTTTTKANFGGGRTVQVDRTDILRLASWSIRWRILYEEIVVAVDRPASHQYDFYSSGDLVELRWTSVPDSGTILFGDERLFTFEPDDRAGYWLVNARGERILRHTRPWKDRDVWRASLKTTVRWVTYLESYELLWPQTGVAVALLELPRQMKAGMGI